MCFTALDPTAPRTARLKELLQQGFPIEALELPEKIVIPWKDAELRGICRV